MAHTRTAQVCRMLCDRRVWETYGSRLKLEYFPEPWGDAFTGIQSFYSAFPDKDAGPLDSKSLSRLLPYMDGKLIRALNVRVPTDIDVAIRAVQDWARRAGVIEVIKETSEDLDEGKVSTDTLMSRIAAIERSFASAFESVSLVDNPYKKLVPRYDDTGVDRVPTPVVELTKALDGGPGPGELLTYMAPPDGGKTALLVNTARLALENGSHVLYAILERADFWERMYQSGLNRTQRWIREHYEATIEYRRWLKTGTGDVRLLSGADRDVTVADLEREAERLAAVTRKRVDLVVVDYGDLLKSSKAYKSPREEHAVIWKDLRRLAHRLQCPIVTATQLNREGTRDFERRRETGRAMSMTSVAESWVKATDTDFLIAIQRDESQKAAGTAELQILKKKRPGAYPAVPCVFDADRCRVE